MKRDIIPPYEAMVFLPTSKVTGSDMPLYLKHEKGMEAPFFVASFEWFDSLVDPPKSLDMFKSSNRLNDLEI